MAKRVIKENRKLFKKAQNLLVGGVNSPVRSFKYAGVEPLLIKRAKGACVFDYDGNAYIDYVLSWGAAILGHANPQVIKNLKQVLNSGLSFGTTNEREIELARIIQKAVPFISKLRFVNSGTEAVMGAVRLARGYTGKNKIIKFEHAYHGHADYLLASGGSGLATLKIPLSLGVPKEFIKHTLIASYGDKKALEKIFKKYGNDIAAVLVEPVGGNYGVILPDLEFLRYLRKITKKYNTLLIADEVITGFRFNFGSFLFAQGVAADLICFGKIIGGGLPIGAYGGRKEIMDLLAPLGKVYQASTFAGNPLVMTAGITTLKVLAKFRQKYHHLADLAGRLVRAIEKEASSKGIKIKIPHFGSMFSLKFEKKEQFKKFYAGLLDNGIYLAPSEYEANFLSFSHSIKDIEHTINSVKSAFRAL